MRTAAFLEAPWREPAEVLAALGDRPWTIGLMSGADGAGWSYVGAEPAQTCVLAGEDPGDPLAVLADLVGGHAPADPQGPPFQGGVAGLFCYELGDRFEPLGLARHDGWPDLACARYDALLAFDHAARRVLAIGRGESAGAARAR
ncbi:MAG TPA: aminodeoxychorismate synthase component I, partial [Phenylobacterium sp.]|nr:aminodeoxychorismate synthase component I [Phenylobacterium sp.]